MPNTIKFNGKNLTPSKVICVGRNYAAHVEELNNEVPSEPVIFIKPNSSITHDLCTNKNESIHYEGEICFVIKENKLAGVGFGLDLTKRETQNKLKEKGLPWERAKAFDKSAVFSDFVAISGDIEDLRLELHINGTLIQDGGVKSMLNKPDQLLDEIRSFITLEDGDVIMTGTPSGVGAINAGDKFEGRVFNNNDLIVESGWLVSQFNI